MKSVSLILLVVFVTLSATAAKSVLQPRIINGKDATEGQFPHMVSLRTRYLDHRCGATILSNRFILTAAHCVQGDFGNPNNLVAVVGALRRSSGGVVVELDAISAHKKFDLSNQASGIYDVAILRTATEIAFNELVQPIALPKANIPEDRSVKVVTSGWGRHKVIERKISKISNSNLNKANVDIFSSSLQAKHPMYYNSLSSTRSIPRSA